MWIERPEKKEKFINDLLGLDRQVLIVRGARQVGKTSFILNALKGLSDYPMIMLNLLYPSSFKLGDVQYLGRDFLGTSETGETFLKNIELKTGCIQGLKKPLIVFIDEADRYPMVLESIQTLAQFSDRIKFVLTGSNLENLPVKNAATGRKKTFDLFPITFLEFVHASGNLEVLNCLKTCSLKNLPTEFYHEQARKHLQTYLRLGGMPKIIDIYLSEKMGNQIPEMIKDLVFTIEENVKTILGEKSKLYEYEDVLRKMAYLSMNTLKYSQLQVQHAGRNEAKKLVSKTVGARVAHKIRLMEAERDLSKYILFDCGITNFLLNGSDLLNVRIHEKNMAILYETLVGVELIANLVTRDDLFYWKSENKAEVEYILKSPFVGVDVKSKRGDNKSLNSFALLEPKVACLIKICDAMPKLDTYYIAKLPTSHTSRAVPFLTLPHYLTCRLLDFLREV